MSETKMQRGEMWQWFTSVTPPKYKLSKKKKEKANDKYQIRYTAIINSDRLIIGLWRGHNAEPLGVYYMTASGITNICTDGKTWTTGKLECIPGGGWHYWYCGHDYKFKIIDGKDEAIAWLKTHFDENLGLWSWSHCDSVHEIVDRIETNIGFVRRRNTRIRKENRISEWANSLPELPADFSEWVHNTVFDCLNYAFGKTGSTKYLCTACGRSHIAKSWKHGKIYECGRTGKKIKVDKCQDSHIARERIMLIQSHHDMDGTICTVARHFAACAKWDKINGYHQRYWPETTLMLPLDGSTCCGDMIVYNQGDDRWSDINTSGYAHSRTYCYPDVSALQGTAYSDIGIDVAAANGWKLNYNNLMRDRHSDPRIEYIIKGGFYHLLDDIIQGTGDGRILMEGDNIQDVLGIDGQAVARLRQQNGGAYYLAWLRAAFMCDYKLPEETLEYLCKEKISPKDIAFALQCGMSPAQVVNYLKKPHAYTKKYSYYVRSKSHIVINQWADYISMAKKLGIDISKSSVHKPKDLKARHDELILLHELHKNELERDRIESEYPNIKPVCEKIKALYEWSDGEYEIIVPDGAFDIIQEGKRLSLCFDRTDRYFDRIAEEESYIVFLRRVANRNSPWYTMEIEPGGCIRQLRTYGDDEGSDRDEAKEFLKKWRKEISRRIGSAEREAAAISREKRVAEFEELRRNGNIIRNGKLAGKLLVEVLEADFKECNAEYEIA